MLQEKLDDAEQAKIRAEQNADALKTQSKVQTVLAADFARVF